ncbi:MAG: alpha/beta fold hydrolase [bacterium]
MFGILHYPQPNDNGAGLVFCQAFAEEQNISHRIMANFARALAAGGYHVLRFDYMGCGDSSGESGQATIATRVADVLSSIALLKKKTGLERIGLLGLRLGAVCAALAAEKNPGIAFLILCAPVVDVKNYLWQLLRSNVAAQMVIYGEIRHDREQLVQNLMSGQLINIDGYDLSKEFYQEAIQAGLADALTQFPGSALLVDISEKARLVDLALAKIAQSQKNGKAIEVIQASAPAFWIEPKSYVARTDDLYSKTIAWLDHVTNRSDGIPHKA